MTHDHRSPRSFSIPSHWTPAQADAVFEFLARIADEVFLAYEDPLTTIAQQENLDPPPHDAADSPAYLDEDIPF